VLQQHSKVCMRIMLIVALEYLVQSARSLAQKRLWLVYEGQ